jgi:hypothetical protein
MDHVKTAEYQASLEELGEPRLGPRIGRESACQPHHANAVL